ncbi:Solute carrier family 43 member 3 [Penaeus vannamei]|uniref:Solute carrier family 43 member 3 n=1 Tax=Penaeus vannamei TaxID=6689 RepID=A0A423T8E7_PENVA|nr:Solute carrier family 43 member 3 [Penaeus vannamei]
MAEAPSPTCHSLLLPPSRPVLHRAQDPGDEEPRPAPPSCRRARGGPVHLPLLRVCRRGVPGSRLCLMLARPSVIAIGNSFVRARFPGDHFHRLIGIYGTIVSVLTILQYPHFLWAQQDYNGAQGFIIAMLIVSSAQPLHLLSDTYLRKVVHMEQTTLSDETTVPLSEVCEKKPEVVRSSADPPQPA